MQQTKFLNKSALEILEKAKVHAKKNYKDKVTSIASVLRSENGRYYTGINVKYKNIWKCICAERVSIAKAIENGNSNFDLIVSVKYSREEDSYEVVNMCGECLQIAINYQSLKVIVDDKGILRMVPVKDVFPFPYI